MVLNNDMSIVNRWIWAQYTPGAGGKMLCSMLQLSTKVHPWYKNIHENFEKFVESKIKINPINHLRNEPNYPYSLSWYTRQLPFTRGDNLTTQEAEDLFIKSNKTNNYSHLTMHWTKPYFPKWFTGQAITIINDKESLKFLKNRRDAIFYKWNDNIVHFKRFSYHAYHNNLINIFKDNPAVEKKFNTKEEFYKEEFYKNPEVFKFFNANKDNRVKLNINLSDFWNKSGSHIATQINEKFNLDIDLKKADYLLDNWLKNNLRFL